MKKLIFVKIIVLLIIIGAIFAGYGGYTESTFYLPGKIEAGNVNDLSLAIYYMCFWTWSRFPVRQKDLTGGWCYQREQYVRGFPDRRVRVFGRSLRVHSDLINQVFSAELIPTGNKVATGDRIPFVMDQRLFDRENYLIGNEVLIDARLHYVFTHREYGEIFSFVASHGKWGGRGVIVNGVEVEYDSIFIEMVLPFLPRRDVETLRWYFSL